MRRTVRRRPALALPSRPWTLSRGDGARRVGVTVLLLVGFGLLVVAVEAGWFQHLDQVVSDWATSARERAPVRVARVVTDIADPEVLLPALLLLGLWSVLRDRRVAVIVDVVIRLGLVAAAVLLIKPLLALPGPTLDPLGDHGGAFPSGHATGAVVCAWLLTALLRWPRRRGARVLLVVAVVAVVSASLLYLNYHYVSDILGGWLLGAAIVSLPLPSLGSGAEPTG